MVQYLQENFIEIIGLVVGTISLIITIRQYLHSKQLEIFSTYVEKYNAIVKPEIYGKWYAAVFKYDKAYWEELEPVMIAYLNLVWEEVHLRDEKLISQKIWEIWEKEIYEIIRSKFAQDILCRYHYPDLPKLLRKN